MAFLPAASRGASSHAFGEEMGVRNEEMRKSRSQEVKRAGLNPEP